MFPIWNEINRGGEIMNNVNRITLCKDNYESESEFENAIKTAIMLLLNANYIMTVKYDEPGLGIVCIDFDHDDECLGCDYPRWLSPDEFETIVNAKEQ